VAEIVEEISSSEYTIDHRLSRFRCIPIRETLAEVRADGARSPARLFTYKIQRYAFEQRKRGVVKAIGG